MKFPLNQQALTGLSVLLMIAVAAMILPVGPGLAQDLPGTGVHGPAEGHRMGGAAPQPQSEGGPENAEGMVRHGPLKLTAAWARASAGRAVNGAAYLTIENMSDRPDRLIAVESPVADVAELHETRMENGIMRMREVAGGIPVPAGGSVGLAPGGYHVMLLGLKEPLTAGTAFDLTLRFRQAGTITLTVPVRPIAAGAPHSSFRDGGPGGNMRGPMH